jgi:SAM-dependent methyltransferase
MRPSPCHPEQVNNRVPFAGGDQRYLAEVQYVDGRKLDARVQLHRRFSTSPVPMAQFEAALIEWQPQWSVLECGCGTGRFWAAPALPRTMSITLTDLSAGMVSEAAAAATEAGFGHVVGRPCDVQQLPFDDDSFEVVVANHMLYHVPDPDLAIAEMARVLRPGGVLLAATNAYGHMRELNEMVAAVFGDHGEQLYEVFGLDSGEARLRRHFRSIVWHAFDNDLDVDDPAAVVDYGLSFPPGESATPEQRAELARVVADSFADGRLRIRTRAGVFVCCEARTG